MKYYNYPKGTKVAVDLDSENTAVVKGPDGKYIVPNELPAVTPEDAEKVVKVNEDGTGIEYVEADEEIFVVTFTDDGVHITMDVSGEDLVSAIKDGKCVYGKMLKIDNYGKLYSDIYDLIKFTDGEGFAPAIIEFAKINIIPPVSPGISPTGKQFTSAYEEKFRVETAFWGTNIQFNKTSIPTAYFGSFLQPQIGSDWTGPDFDNISEAVQDECPVFAWVDDMPNHHHMTILSSYTRNAAGELTSVEFTSLDGSFSFKKEAGDTLYTRIERIPECPITTDGSFVLKATVSNGAVTYSWVAES